MKKIFVLTAILGLVVGGMALADDVAITSHNLSTSGTGTYHADGVVGGTAEVCVFCHTPHAASGSVGVVLWNRAVNVAGYTMYTSATIDMTIAGQPQGVSMACLSCHDGTLAFDQLINGPGSDDYDPAAASRGWSFAGGTDLSGAGVTYLSQDLSDDHPVSITYDTAQDPDFNTIADVETAGLELYGAGNDQVECGSCHNPHEDVLPTFLRISNAGSAVCITCHIK